MKQVTLSLSFRDGAEEEEDEEEERCDDALDCDVVFVGTDTLAPAVGLGTFDGAEDGVR